MALTSLWRFRSKRADQGREIMAVVRQTTESGAQREIALKAGTTQECVAQAFALLRGAPDLADAMIAGTMRLAKAYRP